MPRILPDLTVFHEISNIMNDVNIEVQADGTHRAVEPTPTVLIPMPPGAFLGPVIRGDAYEPHDIESWLLHDDSEAGWHLIGYRVVPNPRYFGDPHRPNPDPPPVRVDMSALSMIFTMDPREQPNLQLLDRIIQGQSR